MLWFWISQERDEITFESYVRIETVISNQWLHALKGKLVCVLLPGRNVTFGNLRDAQSFFACRLFCGWVFSRFCSPKNVWWFQVMVWLGIFWLFSNSFLRKAETVSDKSLPQYPRRPLWLLITKTRAKTNGENCGDNISASEWWDPCCRWWNVLTHNNLSLCDPLNMSSRSIVRETVKTEFSRCGSQWAQMGKSRLQKGTFLDVCGNIMWTCGSFRFCPYSCFHPGIWENTPS